ncbi:MAG: hypothetical protein IPK07_35565 [Deltaproteobacteria bacterium]|nr:hypothetical protein [Deltaproteobacteria bacterium]
MGGDAVYGEARLRGGAARLGRRQLGGQPQPGAHRLTLGRGYIAYNFTRPYAMRDNFAQMILDQLEFLKVLLALRVDASACPGADASAAPTAGSAATRARSWCPARAWAPI